MHPTYSPPDVCCGPRTTDQTCGLNPLATGDNFPACCIFKKTFMPQIKKAFENECQNICLEQAGVPSACYPPDADFLVRSVLRKAEVMKSYEQFKNLRENFVGKPVTNRFNVTWEAMKVSDIKK